MQKAKVDFPFPLSQGRLDDSKSQVSHFCGGGRSPCLPWVMKELVGAPMREGISTSSQLVYVVMALTGLI